MDVLSSTLQQYWGVSAFRPLQQEAVTASLEVGAHFGTLIKRLVPVIVSHCD